MTMTAADIDRLLDDRLRPARTLALVTLGCVGLAEAVLLSALLLTEPEPLPLDTTVALAAIAAGGLAWAGYALWRLRNRDVLLLRGRLVAAALATTMVVSTTIGGTAIALGRDRPTMALAFGTAGVALTAATGGRLIRARDDVVRSRRRLAELGG